MNVNEFIDSTQLSLIPSMHLASSATPPTVFKEKYSNQMEHKNETSQSQCSKPFAAYSNAETAVTLAVKAFHDKM
jgi:hypothetical protein